MMDLAYLLILLISRIRVFLCYRKLSNKHLVLPSMVCNPPLPLFPPKWRESPRDLRQFMPIGPTIGSLFGHLSLLVLECPLAVIVPLLRRTTPRRPPANLVGVGGWGGGGEGGGVLPGCRGNIPQEDEDSDAVSLLPAEDIPLPILPQMGSKFRVFQDSINKTSEPLASPLPEDMASCFNATYHKTSLAETSEVKDLLTTTLRPSNIDMVVRTTNNGLFSLNDPAMPNIRSRDAKLQEAEGSLVKSSYVTMKLAEELAQAHSRGDLSPQLYDVLSDRCLHSLTLNSVAVQQLDQVRRSAFKPVLPAHLKGLAKVPPPPLPHMLNYLETTSLPAKRN